MRALNILSMITVLFFLVLALFLKPVVMETLEILSEPVEERCTEYEKVRMDEVELTSENIKSLEVDTSWHGKQSQE